jgi:nicotinate-nucleotide adenylyltransferase
MTSTLLYGGTFDPVHNGHVDVPFAALQHLGFDRVLFVPAHIAPLKERAPTPSNHRHAMLQLALADSPWAEISTVELDREGTSYTIDTIEAVLAEGESIRLLIGADQWKQFQSWKRWEEIIAIANPAIMPREGCDVEDERLLPITPLTAASTHIRSLVRDGTSIEHLVNPQVAAYITKHNLYR